MYVSLSNMSISESAMHSPGKKMDTSPALNKIGLLKQENNCLSKKRSITNL